MNLNYMDINGHFVFAQIIMIVCQNQGIRWFFSRVFKNNEMKIYIENLNF